MKKSVLLLSSAIMILAFSSCLKEKFGKDGTNMLEEAIAYKHIVTLTSSDYTRTETEPVARSDSKSPYTEGVLEYTENGNVTARVDFSKGGNTSANVSDQSGDGDVNLKKESDKESDYDKIVVEPLVKSDDCDYIVAGTIEFYENDVWVATIDFGDGTCDNVATKQTDDFIYFSLDDWKTWWY